ncbi:MAG: FtsX-like permease family protein, partial [Gemmatimonadaceae bacterium]
SGRYFTAEDKANSPGVTVVGESFAKRHFGNASPLGQRVQVGGEKAKWREIVGVVGDVKQTSLSSDEVNGIYFPEAQWNFVDNAMTMVVRTRGDALQHISHLRTAIWSVDKDQPFIRIATSEKLMEDTASERRFALVLFESFAILALVLAAAGIYGVLSGTVSERIRELGVRAALGATSKDQVAMVLRQGLALTGVGVVIGVAAALVSSRVFSGMLYNISPVDPITYLGVSAALVAVALLACWIPARRASQASPMEALRAD